MKNRKTQGSLRQHLRSFAVGIVLGSAVIGIILLQPKLRAFLTGDMVRDGMGMFMVYWMAAILIFVAAVFAQVVIHEAGHLVCGLASGYRFVSFRVGSTMLFRDGEGWHLGRFSMAGTGGQCLLAPPDDNIGSAATMPYKAYCMGGVAANLLTAAIAAAVPAVCRGGVAGTYILTAVALSGIILGVMNGVPMQMSGIPNDGRNMLTMKRSPDMRRMLWLQLEIHALYSRGTMLRDMPDEWFRLPDGADLSNHMYTTIAGLDASRRTECRDFAGAYGRYSEMRSSGDRMIWLFRMETACEMTLLAVMLHRPRPEIEALFPADAERYARLYSRHMISRALTVYVWDRFVRHDAAKAADTAAKIRTMAGRYPVRGEARGCIELLDMAEALNDEEYGVD